MRKELVSQALASGLWLGPSHPPSHSPPLTPLSSSRSSAGTVPRPLCRRDAGLFSLGGTRGLPAPPFCPGHRPVSPTHPWRHPSLLPSPLPSTASLPGGPPGCWLSPCSQLCSGESRAEPGRGKWAGPPGLVLDQTGGPQTRLLEPGRCGPACDRGVCTPRRNSCLHSTSCPAPCCSAPPRCPRAPDPQAQALLLSTAVSALQP